MSSLRLGKSDWPCGAFLASCSVGKRCGCPGYLGVNPGLEPSQVVGLGSYS